MENIRYKTVRLRFQPGQTFQRAEMEVPNGWHPVGFLTSSSHHYVTIKNSSGLTLLNRAKSQFFTVTQASELYSNYFQTNKEFADSKRIIIEAYKIAQNSDTFFDYIFVFERKNNQEHIQYKHVAVTLPANQTDAEVTINLPHGYYADRIIGVQGTHEISLLSPSGSYILNNVYHLFFAVNFDYFTANYKTFFKLPDELKNYNNFTLKLHDFVSHSAEIKYEFLFVLKKKSFFQELHEHCQNELGL